MSKKHFIELANMVRETKPAWDEPVEIGSTKYYQLSAMRIQWEKMRDALADLCARENRNFKRDRWIGYINGECGPNGGAVKAVKNA